MLKRSNKTGYEMSEQVVLTSELEALGFFLGTEDRKKGLKSFLEQKEPKFKSEWFINSMNQHHRWAFKSAFSDKAPVLLNLQNSCAVQSLSITSLQKTLTSYPTPTGLSLTQFWISQMQYFATFVTIPDCMIRYATHALTSLWMVDQPKWMESHFCSLLFSHVW